MSGATDIPLNEPIFWLFYTVRNKQTLSLFRQKLCYFSNQLPTISIRAKFVGNFMLDLVHLRVKSDYCIFEWRFNNASWRILKYVNVTRLILEIFKTLSFGEYNTWQEYQCTIPRCTVDCSIHWLMYRNCQSNPLLDCRSRNEIWTVLPAVLEWCVELWRHVKTNGMRKNGWGNRRDRARPVKCL